MNSFVIEKHQAILENWLKRILEGELDYFEPWFVLLKDKAMIGELKASSIRNSCDGEHSYIRCFREYLQYENGLNLAYDDAINIVSEVFGPAFDELRFFEAEQTLNIQYPSDRKNSTAEWRAYFEYRFRHPLKKFFERNLTEHWLSANISLYSFLAEQTLPVYRSHFGLPNRKHSQYNNKAISPQRERENNFSELSNFQQKYSTVWEVVENNVSSIFYFDKTPEKKRDMVVYEIDPDARPGQGRVKPRFMGKYVLDETHRGEGSTLATLLEDKDSDAPWKVYSKARKDDEAERQYQYRIIRFFIRSGIFKPSKAAVSEDTGKPIFRDLIHEAIDKLKKDEHPMLEDETVTQEAIEKIVESQFNSSKNKERHPYKNDLGVWQNYDHNDKYTESENTDLDKAIELLDAAEPQTLDVRLALFEAGFFLLGQKDNTISHIYWLPIIINWRDREVGGAVFLNSDKRIGTDKAWKQDRYGHFFDGSDEPSTSIDPDMGVPQVLIDTLYYLSGLFNDKLIGSIE